MDFHAAVEKLNKKIQEKVDELVFDEMQAFKDFCINVLGNAVALAPVEWGDLRGTAFLEINGNVVAIGQDDGSYTFSSAPIAPSDIMTARVVFPMKYAVVQHEHPEFHHEEGQAYFLEIGAEQAIAEYAARLRGR